MKSGIEVLMAQGSNLPPFDIKVPVGVDPVELAGNIAATSSVKSGLDVLNASIPKPPLPPEPKPVNLEAYDVANKPSMIMLAPGIALDLRKKSEPLPPEPPKLEQGGQYGEVKRGIEAENLALNVMKSSYPSAEKSYLLGVTRMYGIRPEATSPDLATAIKAGFNQSVMGRRGVALGYKQEMRLTPEQYEAMSEPTKFIYSLSTFVGDLPTGLFGSVVGVHAGGLVGALGGFFGFNEGLRSYYDQLIEKGEVRGPLDFLKYANEVAKKELGGIATGKATAVAGAFGGLPAEILTLSTIPPLLESRLPTVEDYYNTASFLLGLNLITKGPKAVGKMREIFRKTGMTPKEMQEQVKVDPVLADTLTNDSDAIPPDVLKRAEAKVREAEQRQADLAAAAAIAKEKPTPETIVKEELKVKGNKVKEIKGIDVQDLIREGKARVIEPGIDKANETDITRYIRQHPNNYYHSPGARIETTKAGTVHKSLILAEKGSDPYLTVVRHYQDIEEVQLPKKPKIAKVSEGADHKEINKYWDKGYDVVEIGERLYAINPKRVRKSLTDMGIVESLNELKSLGYDEVDIQGMSPKQKAFILQQGIRGMVEPIKSGVELLQPKPKIVKRKAEKKQPITDVDLQTGTPLPKELSPGEHPFRDKDKVHTDEMSKLFIDKIKNKEIDPEVFTRYLINEMNRYLNGDEPSTPVEKIRNGLSNASANAENARLKFNTRKDFLEWKDTVTEAARWAREADRPKKGGVQLNMGIDPTVIKQLIYDLKGKIAKNQRIVDEFKSTISSITSRGPGYAKGKEHVITDQTERMQSYQDKIDGYKKELDRLINKRTGGTQLNMMIPVNELPEIVKDLLKNIKLGMPKIFGEDIPANALYRNREIFDKTGFWLGKDGKWRYEIGDEGLKVRPEFLKAPDLSNAKLPQIVDHPTLYEAIPELKDAKIVLDRQLRHDGEYRDSPYTGKSIVVKRPDKSIIVHEVQHAVDDIMKSKFRGSSVEVEQSKLIMEGLSNLKKAAKSLEVKKEIEGIEAIYKVDADPKALKDRISKMMWEKVKDPKESADLYKAMEDFTTGKAFENYMKDPGEMEARLASARMEMTPEQRKSKPPWETLDKMLTSEGLADPTSYSEGPPSWTRIPVMSDAGKGKKSPGSTLYMGIDPTQIPEVTKKIIEGAKSLVRYTEKARGMKEFKPGAAIQQLREEFIRSGVDRSGNIRRDLLDQLGDEGYRIIQKMYLTRGASSLAAQQLKQMRSEVYDGLSKREKLILDRLILADRMIDIGSYKLASQFKFPEDITPVKSAAYKELFAYIEGLEPGKVEILNQRAGAYFDWMKKPLKDMLDAELISQAEYDALASHNYRRLKLVDVFDKRYQTKIGKRKRTVYDSGIEALSHGRDTDVFEPSSEVMALEVFNRAYGRILNNEANRTLLDLVRTQKDNPFVAVKDSPSDHIPSGWDRIFVYEKGERKAIYISPEMSKEWITNNPEMSYKLSQFIRYASGSPVLRTFATGIDWGFALANLPRDIMHIWYAARVFENGKWKPLYNTTMPIYFGQMGSDIGAVFNDAILRKGRYQDYIKEGGGMEFLVHQGRLLQRGRHIEGTIDKVQDFLGYLGETSEIVTRLAIRDRVIKRRAAEQGISYEEAVKDKKITQEATFAARDYMDFGQGGGISKALDNGLPYLNASIQGTRGMFRAFKDNPAESTVKLAQFAALVTGLYIANQSLNPKTMESLKGDISMQGNLVIPLGDGFGFLDEKGQQRYPYIKIPLDPGQKFFKTFFEAASDKMMGNKVDVNAVTNSLSQVSPVAISSLPPTVSGTLGYMYNKDFWLNDEIWKKTDKPLGWPQSKEEYVPGQTPQALVDIGSVTGLSPERLKYALSELVTSGSVWSWLVGQGYDAAFHDLPQNKKEMHLAEVLSKTPMIKRFIGITNPYSQFAEPVQTARDESMLKRWIENRGLDQRVESFLYEGGKKKDVTEYISKFKDVDTQDRLWSRFEFQEAIKDLPNRSFWLSLKGTPDTEARAKLYFDRVDSATSEEKKQLQKEFNIIDEAGGVISDSFIDEVMKLKSKKAKVITP